MTEHTDRLTDGQEEFELERRGYSRRQVDEFAAKTRNQARDLENRLSHALDENERLRLEASAARQAAGGRPAHEEISERVGQILKLADEEAKSQRNRANDEIAKQRSDAKAETDRMRAEAKQETDKFRAEAQSQAERMLRAAQEQAENSVASARAEAEKTRNAARAEAERSITDAHKQAENSVATAKAQAKQVLDEATARATAIHDGAERRLNLLMSRHTEAIRRLTEIRDVVTTLVAGVVPRGSLEEEVEKAVASAIGDNKAPAGRPAGPAEGRHAPAGPAVQAAPGVPSAPGAAPAPSQAPGVAPAQAPGAAPAQAPNAPVIGQQVPGRVQPGPRTQPPAAKPAEVPGVGNGQGARVPNVSAESHVAPARPAGPGEGARHAAGSDRPDTGEDTADNVRIVPE